MPSLEIIKQHLCYLLLPPLFAGLGLDHLVDVVPWRDTHGSEARGGNLLGKGDNEDVAGVQPRTEERAGEVWIVEKTELKLSFCVRHGGGQRGIGDYCVVRKNHSCICCYEMTLLIQVPTYLYVSSSSVHYLSYPGPFFMEALVFFRLRKKKGTG